MSDILIYGLYIYPNHILKLTEPSLTLPWCSQNSYNTFLKPTSVAVISKSQLWKAEQLIHQWLGSKWEQV